MKILTEFVDNCIIQMHVSMRKSLYDTFYFCQKRGKRGKCGMKAKKTFALFLTLSMGSNILPVTASAKETEIPVITQDLETEQANTSLPSEDEEMPSLSEDIKTQEEDLQTPSETQSEDVEVPSEIQDTVEQNKPQNRSELKTILFDNNGAEGTTPEGITLASGDVFMFIEDPDITKQGFVFMGWSTKQDATEPLFQREEHITTEKLFETEEQTITLYAVWKEIQDCQILYDLGNNEIIREYTKTGELPQNIPTQNKEGKQIIAWKNADDEMVELAKQVTLKNAAYFAVYEQSEQLTPQSDILETEKHIPYMNGSNGNFYPEKALTRAEACQILYTLLKQKPQPNKTFSDVSADQWYANPVCTLATMGLVEGYGENFEPDSEMTRAEFLTILNRIYPSDTTETQTFVDVSAQHWAFSAICNAAQKGWINPQENIFPDDTIKRQDVAVILNKVLHRTGDKNTIDNADTVKEFFDVPSTHWAYYDILESSVVHEYQKTDATEMWTSFQKEGLDIAPGLYSKNGTLFCIEENGHLARNKTVGNFTFNENGYYTTGYPILDEKLSEIVRTQTDESMTQEEKLHTLHNYIRDNYRYLKRPFVSKGEVGWEAEYAIPMLETNKGNCYSFAALYYYLAKQIGYDAQTAIGTIGHNYAPHGWIEIGMDGTTYLFDAEMEMAYRLKGQYYDIFKKTYHNAPFIYIKW